MNHADRTPEQTSQGTESVAADAATVSVTVTIDNVYDDGTVTTTETATVPAPPVKDPSASPGLHEMRMQEWADDYLQELTGTGRTEGDAGYFLRIDASSDPALVDLEFEWGV